MHQQRLIDHKGSLHRSRSQLTSSRRHCSIDRQLCAVSGVKVGWRSLLACSPANPVAIPATVLPAWTVLQVQSASALGQVAALSVGRNSQVHTIGQRIAPDLVSRLVLTGCEMIAHQVKPRSSRPFPKDAIKLQQPRLGFAPLSQKRLLRLLPQGPDRVITGSAEHGSGTPLHPSATDSPRTGGDPIT
jgi:hypothetical protein